MTGRKKVPKRFEGKWATHPECEGIIHEAWNGVISTGCLMYRLFEKIKTTRMSLVGWSRQLGNSKTKLEEKKLELEHLTAMNTTDNLDVIQKVKDEINALLLQEKLFWRQRLDQFGYLQGIRTQNIFIREQARGIEKITFQVFWMTRADGAILRMRLQVWLKNTSKFYLILLLRLI